MRGLLPVEINAALRQSGVAGDVETVCRDLDFLEEVWETEVHLDAKKHQARLLAELREARRAAWAAGRFDLVLKALAQEAELLEKEKPPAMVEMLKLG